MKQRNSCNYIQLYSNRNARVKKHSQVFEIANQCGRCQPFYLLDFQASISYSLN